MTLTLVIGITLISIIGLVVALLDWKGRITAKHSKTVNILLAIIIAVFFALFLWSSIVR